MDSFTIAKVMFLIMVMSMMVGFLILAGRKTLLNHLDQHNKVRKEFDSRFIKKDKG